MEKVRRICVLLLMVATWLGWPALRAQSYDNLWKQVGQAQDKSLPQTVVKLTDEIYRKALAEKNSPQLLKAYLYRESTKAIVIRRCAFCPASGMSFSRKNSMNACGNTEVFSATSFKRNLPPEDWKLCG